MTECTYSVSKREPGKRLAIDDLVVMPDGSVDIIESVCDISDQECDAILSYKISGNWYPFFAVRAL